MADKTNPNEHVRTLQTRTWKKKGENLSKLCTAKERKEGTGGSVTKFFVAIAYGKGVIACDCYVGHVSGEILCIFYQGEVPKNV